MAALASTLAKDRTLAPAQLNTREPIANWSKMIVPSSPVSIVELAQAKHLRMPLAIALPVSTDAAARRQLNRRVRTTPASMAPLVSTLPTTATCACAQKDSMAPIADTRWMIAP